METPNSDPQSQDTELVAKLCLGDDDALRELYYRYFDRLYSLVFHQVGGNKDIAEDIVQDTFLAMLKSAGNYRGHSKFYTWLCSIAYHKIADFYRQQKRQAGRGIEPLDIESLETERRFYHELTTSGIDESKETRQAFEEALMSLRSDYRQVLIFKYVEEMSVHEISKIMHRSPKSVEGLLARGRKVLRDIIADSGEG